MNKKLLPFLLTIVLCTAQIIAEECGGTVEFRSAAFIPASDRFREVLGKVGATYGVEASMQFCGCFSGWVDVDFIPMSRSHGDCCKSKIDIYNGSFGVNYLIPLTCSTQAYVGLGASIARVTLKSHSTCCREHTSKIAGGGVVKSGIRFTPCEQIFFDVFADYLYLPVDFHKTVDVGGLKVGLGLGVSF